MSSEVRKTVTIVFTDLVGSTSLGERLDPEAVRGVISRYFDAMQAAIEHHGGSVEKFIGDAVMAVFGLPTLHEDDALRAARADLRATRHRDACRRFHCRRAVAARCHRARLPVGALVGPRLRDSGVDRPRVM